jgi:hypothetical protein
MPVSLGRFLEFLEGAVGFRCPWAAAVLDELIESGIRGEDELWGPLVERQRGWMKEKGLL